jgi:hypothetical protein
MLQAKLLHQKIDILHPKADWKSHNSLEETQEWHQLTDELTDIHKLKIPRQLRHKEEARREYHIFTDASRLAIGATIYCVSYPHAGSPKVTLIAAKSKIIPYQKPRETTKTNFQETTGISINKLELNGALLGLQLFETLRPSLEKTETVHCWTDSLVGLTWIRNGRRTGIKYIDTRLEKIWELSKPEFWNHCPGKENPADMATRVCSTKDLLNNQTWLEGPEWLRDTSILWPNLRKTTVNIQSTRTVCETCLKYPAANTCKGCGHRSTSKERCRFMEKYLSRGNDQWKLIFRRYYYFNRVKMRLLKRKKDPTQKPTDWDLELAQIKLLRDLQKYYDLEHWKKLVKKDTILDGLAWDEDLQLLVSRSRQHQKREERSPLERNLIHVPVDNNHPESPGTNPFIKALMRESHITTGHGPAVPTYVHLRQKFWCAQAKKIAQRVKRTCPTCIKIDSKPFKAPEAALRDYRYIGDRIFETMGVDFVGPFSPLESSNKPVSVIVFTCPLTCLVLLRPVEGVGAEEFRFTLNTVCNEHNLEPKLINSDRAKTFLNVWERTIKKYHLLINEGNQEGEGPKPRWDFNASRAPWWVREDDATDQGPDGTMSSNIKVQVTGIFWRWYFLHPESH